MLEIKNLTAGTNSKRIIKNLSLGVKKGEVHVIVGPNASGKSTLARIIMGLNNYRIESGKIIFNNKDITNLPAEKRARLGIALTFQHPPALKGLKLKTLLEHINKSHFQNPAPQLLEREVNVGFSGGEQKFSEVTQIFALNPKLAIFDEIDSGVDIKRIEELSKLISEWLTDDKAALFITHSGSLMKFINPDVIHVMLNGRFVCSANDWMKVWKTIKRYGYEKCKECRLPAD